MSKKPSEAYADIQPAIQSYGEFVGTAQKRILKTALADFAEACKNGYWFCHKCEMVSEEYWCGNCNSVTEFFPPVLP